MGKGRIVSLRLLEGLEGWHLKPVLKRTEIGTVSAVTDLRTRVGEKCLG
jgi:hypothetical protein